jgi:hypothetical protein
MSRFLIASFIVATITAGVSTSASAYHCLARAPNGASATAFGVFLGRAHCAGAYTAAAGLVAQLRGAGRTKRGPLRSNRIRFAEVVAC